MNSKNHSIRSRAMLALGVASALIGGGSAAAVGTTPAGAQTPGPIKSGAGPGWPATLSPSDFVRRVDNPWFPLKPGSKYRYKGAKGHTKMIDVMKVTHRTKRILGVKATVVHDVVRVHGRREEVTSDFYAQDRHRNVWYFGEATKELDRHGNTISGPVSSSAAPVNAMVTSPMTVSGTANRTALDSSSTITTSNAIGSRCSRSTCASD